MYIGLGTVVRIAGLVADGVRPTRVRDLTGAGEEHLIVRAMRAAFRRPEPSRLAGPGEARKTARPGALADQDGRPRRLPDGRSAGGSPSPGRSTAPPAGTSSVSGGMVPPPGVPIAERR